MRALAVILESGEPERLYTGLSLAVCAAAAGRPVSVLTGFGATRALASAEPASPLPEPLAATLGELIATARELCSVRACSAAAGHGLAATAPADPVSMPQFLADAGDAELLFV